MLSKAEILKRSVIDSKSVFIKAWDGEVTIKKLTIKEREEVDKVLYGDATAEEMKAGSVKITTDVFSRVSVKVVSLCLMDEKGKQMFTEDELSAFSDDNTAAISEIYQALEEFDKPKK